MTGNQHRHSTFSTVILIASVILILAVVTLYLILSSRLKASQQEYRLYYVSKSSGALIRSEKRIVLGTDDAAPTPRQLINALLDGPVSSDELRSPFPASLHIRSVTESDGLLCIDFSGSYAEMEPFERRLADCCLFRTVSALDGIYSVSLYANGIPLPGGQALTKSSFITQTDFFQSQAEDVVFYYPASDLESLHTEARTCMIYQDTSAAEIVVQILFDEFFRCNPAGGYFPSLLLHSVRTEADVAYVDLSLRFLTSEFIPSPPPPVPDDDDDTPVMPLPDDEPTKSELTGALYLQAIVLSLTELDGINEVQFTFDGQIVEQYSDLKLSSPLKRDRTIPIH